jgi:hypothetical protein
MIVPMMQACRTGFRLALTARWRTQSSPAEAKEDFSSTQRVVMSDLDKSMGEPDGFTDRRAL